MGVFQAGLDDVNLTHFDSQKVRILLAYLMVESGRPHSREVLAEMLWPGRSEKVALKNLRDALANLRSVIRDAAASPPRLRISRQDIQFNPESAYNLDVETFSSLVVTAKNHSHRKIEACKTCCEHLEMAAGLFRGHFLEGMFLNGSHQMQNWIALRRERYDQQAQYVFSALVQYYIRQMKYERALDFAYRQVEIDPWRETAYEQLMLLLVHCGERSTALKQYQVCRKILADELGIEPTESIRRLYEQIRTGEMPAMPQSPPPAGFPMQFTSFVGREEELKQIAGKLQNPACRMLTLAGVGGVGKTRLALQAAMEQTFAFRDGVYFVPLDAVSQFPALVMAIAESLSVSFWGKDDLPGKVIDFLRKKELLLVLDNFEQFLAGDAAGVDFLEEILREAKSVVLLVTSRQAVRLAAEWLFEVRGFQYPEREDDAKPVDSYQAVQLFLERSRQVQACFEPSGADLQAIVGICSLVEGLPLGVELAAALVRVHSCSRIFGFMEQRMGTLRSDIRNVPERHRSLQAVFTCSWDLLTRREREAFMALSVFMGGFTFEAADDVLARWKRGDAEGGKQATERISGLVFGLVDKSLLRFDAGENRFQMHGLVHRFARKKLDEFPDAAVQVRRSHAVWCACFLAGKAPAMFGEEQAAVLKLLRSENGNLSAAWKWALTAGEDELVWQMAPGLFRFYSLQGWEAQGLDAFTKAVETFGKREEAAKRTRLFARLLAYAGVFKMRLSSYREARADLQSSLDISTEKDDKETQAFCLLNLGQIGYNTGDWSLSYECYENSRRINQQLGNFRGKALCENNLGILVSRQGKFDKALEYWEASLTYFTESGDLSRKGSLQNNLGVIYRRLGQYASAAACLKDALHAFDILHDQRSVAGVYNNCGLLAKEWGKYQQAEVYFQKSLAICQEIGERKGNVFCLNNLGLLALAREETDKAEDYFRRSYALSTEIELLSSKATALHNLGMAAVRKGNIDTAQRFFADSLALKMQLGNESGSGHTYLELGKLAMKVHRERDVLTHLQKAWKIASEIRSRPLMLEILFVWAKRIYDSGDTEKAAGLLAAVIGNPACLGEVKAEAERFAMDKKLDVTLSDGYMENPDPEMLADSMLRGIAG